MQKQDDGFILGSLNLVPMYEFQKEQSTGISGVEHSCLCLTVDKTGFNLSYVALTIKYQLVT
jgi:hypothetical protein